MKPERQEYKGHRIEVRAREAYEPGARQVEPTPELIVDDEPIRYGQLPDGLYYLNEYAYDWTGDLMDLARKLIDHRIRAAAIRGAEEPGGGR